MMNMMLTVPPPAKLLRSVALLIALTVLADASSAAAATPPVLTSSFSGPAVPVFDTTTQACDATDTPDAPARAYRDSNGIVHLHASGSTNRAMTGNSLLTVARNCAVVMNSALDPNPAHFAQAQWLAGFYTNDGKNIAALVHTEYHGQHVPGQCLAAAANAAFYCWYNVIAFAQSTNGGQTFSESPAPRNYVAGLPYQFNKGLDGGPIGYNSPTGIVAAGRFYYAMLNDWPYRGQTYGPCLMRTSNVFDPTSWQGFDGKGFNVQFANPYVQTRISNPAPFICSPVGAGALGEVQSLVYHPASGAYLTTQFTPDPRWGPPGLYLSASWDLINWSKPLLVMSTAAITAGDPAGKWLYEYFSLLDPAASDRSFSTITSNPMIYYVRLDMNNPPYKRVLFRRPLTLNVK